MSEPAADTAPILSEIIVRPVGRDEEPRYQAQMAAQHYLGALPKIGETLWYVATWRGRWLAQIGLSAAALKCGVRDAWIGWDFRSQFGRLKLIANNSRFLILPAGRYPNVGSRVLGLVARRAAHDWPQRFGHPLLLLETFVDPRRFHGGVYRAANWLELGLTRGFRRIQGGYSPAPDGPKRVFVYPLGRHAPARLNHPDRTALGLSGVPRMSLSAIQMGALPQYFADLPDPRRAQGRRHRLAVVLALSAGASLCGMAGYQAMAEWAASLGQAARRRFGCRRVNGYYEVPSLYVIRDCLVRVEPEALERGLAAWQAAQLAPDEALAMDGKTMKGAVDASGAQTHILSLIGHESKCCAAPKKSVR
ncbi:Druantia anti-phage system protein DruA [Pseudomonas aeruginosa]